MTQQGDICFRARGARAGALPGRRAKSRRQPAQAPAGKKLELASVAAALDHTLSMALDLPAVVDAYWRRYELSQGDRAQRLAADDEWWAWEAVEEAVAEPTGDVLAVLDALLAAPQADPCYVGAGPLEELLHNDAPLWQEAVAARGRASAQWRAALLCVQLDSQDLVSAPMLADYLPKPLSGEERPRLRRPRKTSKVSRKGRRR